MGPITIRTGHDLDYHGDLVLTPLKQVVLRYLYRTYMVECLGHTSPSFVVLEKSQSLSGISQSLSGISQS